jgi:hypothetical protein
MALVDDAGNVQSVTLIDDEKQNYQPPEGCELVEATGHAEPGGTYSNGNFTRARIVERSADRAPAEADAPSMPIVSKPMAFWYRLISAIQCSAGLRSRLRPSGQTEKGQSQPE